MLEKLNCYVKRLSILLITVALIACMVGCVSIPGRAVQYTLSISSTAGGTVTTPGEGLFRYVEGTVVNLVAEPDAGYRFVNWICNAETIADIYSAATTITINNYYFLIANFER
jgi:hypothetical protein